MTVAVWAEMSRTELNAMVPEAMVVVAIGATEQHGPHLPVGTDAMIASAIARQASAAAQPRSRRQMILTPDLPFGASDHHLPFGGTLSLSGPTMLSVLTDILRSLHASGARRVVIVNGHGGNSGVTHAAAASATSNSDLRVAHIDYWSALASSADAAPDVPGHAGRFESALMRALRRDLVGDPPHRTAPVVPEPVDGVAVHSARVWTDMDGYSDDPAAATDDEGSRLLDVLISSVADRLVILSEQL